MTRTSVIALVALLVPRVAAAQPATAPAEILFREGKKLMLEGNITAACDAIQPGRSSQGTPRGAMPSMRSRPTGRAFFRWNAYPTTCGGFQGS